MAASLVPRESAFAACARGMAVAVAENLLWAHEPFGLYLTRWQLLNQPDYRNVANAPLAPSAVTLTRSDLLTFARTERTGRPRV